MTAFLVMVAVLVVIGLVSVFLNWQRSERQERDQLRELRRSKDEGPAK